MPDPATPASLPPTHADPRTLVDLRPRGRPAIEPAGPGRYTVRDGLAFDRDLRREVALRVADDLDEARLTARLEHPNIVPVHDVGRTADGRLFFTMKHAAGRPLDGADFESVLKVCDALEFAHAAGAAHGRLTPEHVRVGEFGDVLVTGWGAAATPAEDVAALGAMLPSTPAELGAIAAKAAGGYASVAELREDLVRFREGREVSARRDPIVRRAIKWARRHPVAAATAAAALLALGAGIAGARAQVESARRARAASLLDIARAEPDPARALESAWGALALAPTDAEARALVEALAARRRDAQIEAKRREAEELRAAVRRDSIEDLMRAEQLLRKAQALTAPHGLPPPPERYEVNLALGTRALEGADYTLARMAFATCASLDAARAAGLEERVEEAEHRVARERAARIGEVLEALRAGATAEREDFVYEGVAFTDEQTVRMLAEALEPMRLKAKRDGKQAAWTQPEMDVMIFAFQVLGRVGLESAVTPLAGMMEVLWEHEAVVECGWALCDTRSPLAEAPLSSARKRLGLNSPAWTQISRLLVRVPVSEGGAEPRTAAEFFNRGTARRERGDFDGAIDDYSRAIEINPMDSGAFNNRGIARWRKGNLDGAIDDYSRAIELDPKNAKAFNNRGIARRDNGDLDGAISDCSCAIALDPNFAIAFVNRASAHQKNGNLDGAISDCSRAIELDPQNAKAFATRGYARKIKGDLNGAIDDYSRAIELDPKDASAFVQRGLARWNKGDLDGAIDDHSRAIELDPKHGIAFAGRGNARITRGNRFADDGRIEEARTEWTAGVADLERFIELEPQSPAVPAFRRVLERTRKKLEQP